MELLPCGHLAAAGDRLVCRHLTRDVEIEHVWLFTGRGVDYSLCCLDCERSDGELIVVCEGCVARIEEDGLCLGFRGNPQIRQRLSPVTADLRRVRLPGVPLDLAPIPSRPYASCSIPTVTRSASTPTTGHQGRAILDREAERGRSGARQ